MCAKKMESDTEARDNSPTRPGRGRAEIARRAAEGDGARARARKTAYLPGGPGSAGLSGIHGIHSTHERLFGVFYVADH